MNVPSFQFLLLALAAAVLFHFSSSRPWRQAVLLVANIGFFATFGSSNVLAYLPFAGLLLLGYVGLHRPRNHHAGWLIVAAIVAAFFWLKKYTFIPAPLLINFPYVSIGLSYVFFRVLHLAIDTQQNLLPARPGLLLYLNYTLNFTSLVSGPIQRYEDHRIIIWCPRRSARSVSAARRSASSSVSSRCSYCPRRCSPCSSSCWRGSAPNSRLGSALCPG